MDGSIESRVDHEVDDWLNWLPRWRPGTHRGRARLCRTCFGSPIIGAAGLTTDVPHAVQHALSMRIKRVIDADVDEYTEAHLPLLRREIHLNEQRKAAASYQPTEGLDPAYTGLDLDPPATPDAPYLFTFADLARPEEPSAAPVAPPPLSVEEKAAIRAELKLADEHAALVGRKVCAELSRHQARMRRAVSDFVEPWVLALLADLDTALDSPLWPRGI
ncbi:spermidine/putrescine ABC transporter substrate-binding protein [Cryobacterium sp. TMT1-21]|uniref:Spermidine/putrescine ABC transporter substrate-binding protein n=1 Tax=Cryobacterium shii TaxID=1259235 RepID=A0AAQ2C4M9_9MICO|nr:MULTISPECIES: spermidine/putrescine ABC transporter substrate-binding protein [Cryobacterium]TFC43416.1 spermidine/putrescine ABC transporter substrate-binding protein [Cryobacterium shii]TFC89584.1 spermidine/putrescine ABC transporter substrate-binding protein [Cryobacterium sp. TmT2-59]TFD10458.1 spermidine/putrescine ABC transporter substrate-binding protein [Cryobacterium sp. TMT1-21]TFD14202.1 spermidine/putrescine ABC transporter substrate-binding protein [Cryobacterium sp. TMT4-10]T